MTPDLHAVFIGELRKTESRLAAILGRPPSRRSSSKAIHEARKSIKLLRAALRLLREAIPPHLRHSLNVSLRRASRTLSPLRDREVIEKTGAALALATAIGISGASEHAIPRRPLSLALSELRTIHPRLKTLPWNQIDWEKIDRGVSRIYRRSRKAAKKAESNPTDQRLHEFRKRAKDLDCALSLIDPEGKEAPRLERRVGRMTARLGDDHDLVLLRQSLPQAAPKPLRVEMKKRRYRHQKRAFHLAHRIFSHRLSHWI